MGYFRAPYYRASKPWLEDLKLISVLDDLNRLELHAQNLENVLPQAHEVRALLQSVSTRLYDELHRCYFVFVSAADLYRDPLSGWEAAHKRFGRAEPEITNAGKCLALEMPTAC